MLIKYIYCFVNFTATNNLTKNTIDTYKYYLSFINQNKDEIKKTGINTYKLKLIISFLESQIEDINNIKKKKFNLKNLSSYLTTIMKIEKEIKKEKENTFTITLSGFNFFSFEIGKKKEGNKQ
jgi:hypothetical protein